MDLYPVPQKKTHMFLAVSFYTFSTASQKLVCSVPSVVSMLGSHEGPSSSMMFSPSLAPKCPTFLYVFGGSYSWLVLLSLYNTIRHIPCDIPYLIPYPMIPHGFGIYIYILSYLWYPIYLYPNMPDFLFFPISHDPPWNLTSPGLQGFDVIHPQQGQHQFVMHRHGATHQAWETR